MKPLSVFFLLLCLSIATSPIAAQQQSQPVGKSAKGGHDKYQQACRRTANKDLCIIILKSDPGSAQANMTGLALTAIKAASKNASHIAEYIKTISNDPQVAESPNQDALFDCMDYYIDASEQLDDSTAALLSGAQNDVKTWVGVAIDNAHSCEAAFESQPSVLSQKNEVFVKLCNIALAITNLTA